MRALLAERAFPVGDLRFVASARSAGSTLPWDGGEIVVEDIMKSVEKVPIGFHGLMPS